ncbi:MULTISPECIES: hypothetical protein [Chryseobacterium]|jgi:hypothetical protein|uniref:Uncharacterized protein n=1 Tax=Chryseobacterium indoltheticum TaxID=254 RepID=A0A381FCA9_9FLAO|nr:MULTISPECIES: hypothetical protein [Chryseobacterium]MDQ8143335.1 hypothetical protein [Chryseobacterium sp. CFS15]QQQ29264.1 hypothetical protein JJL46_04440 [Chryseobacterium indoltheticum]SUX44201.1 Uncharacterised protein [Chryseobacterium indoltheticum]
MNYKEALEHKKESLKTADESVLKQYHLVISPANKDESKEFIDAFLENPDQFDDESCKKYSSDGLYEVISFKKEEE